MYVLNQLTVSAAIANISTCTKLFESSVPKCVASDERNTKERKLKFGKIAALLFPNHTRTLVIFMTKQAYNRIIVLGILCNLSFVIYTSFRWKVDSITVVLYELIPLTIFLFVWHMDELYTFAIRKIGVRLWQPPVGGRSTHHRPAAC